MLRHRVWSLLAVMLSAVSAYELSAVDNVVVKVTVTGLDTELYGANYEKTVTIAAGSRDRVDFGSIPYGPTTVEVKYYDGDPTGGGTLTFVGTSGEVTRDGGSYNVNVVMMDQDPTASAAQDFGCKAVTSTALSPYRLKRNSTNTLKVELDDGGTVAASAITVKDDADSAAHITVQAPGTGDCPNVAKTFCIITGLDADTGDDAQISIDADSRAACGSYGDVAQTDIELHDAVISFKADITVGLNLNTITLRAGSDWWVADGSAGNVEVNLGFDGACATTTPITATRTCNYITATGAAVTGAATPAISDKNCADSNELPFDIGYPATLNSGTPTIVSGVCTVTFTVNDGSDPADTATMTYFIGPGDTSLTAAPDTDFAFASRLHYKVSAPLGGYADLTAANTANALLTGVTNVDDKFFLYASFVNGNDASLDVNGIWNCDGTTTIDSVKVDGVTKTATDAEDGKLFQAVVTVTHVVGGTVAAAECSIQVTDPANAALTKTQTFSLHKEVVTYSPTPAPPAQCVAPSSCTQHSISEVSQSQHMYIGGSAASSSAYVEDAVIAIHTQDAGIFQSPLNVDVQHAVDNCAEIEARVDQVSLDADNDVYHISIKELYYNGDWHTLNTQLLVDLTGLTSTYVRVVSTPRLPTGQGLELKNCATGTVVETFAVMQYFPASITAGYACTANEDGVVESLTLVSLTGVCHVVVFLADTDNCDANHPLVLRCDTTCQEHSPLEYLKAGTDGIVTVYSDSACTTSTGKSFAPTGLATTAAYTDLSEVTEYSSQLYPA